MPLIDMPLEQLKVYQGRNPRPQDFDEYWDRAIAEMNAIDPHPVFKPYDFPSVIGDCYELTFTSTKNAKIYAKFIKPKKVNGKIPAVLRFHGLSLQSPNWEALLIMSLKAFALQHWIAADKAVAPRMWAKPWEPQLPLPLYADWTEIRTIYYTVTCFWIPPCWRGLS